jgi:hypothetical protein
LPMLDAHADRFMDLPSACRKQWIVPKVPSGVPMTAHSAWQPLLVARANYILQLLPCRYVGVAASACPPAAPDAVADSEQPCGAGKRACVSCMRASACLCMSPTTAVTRRNAGCCHGNVGSCGGSLVATKPSRSRGSVGPGTAWEEPSTPAARLEPASTLGEATEPAVTLRTPAGVAPPSCGDGAARFDQCYNSSRQPSCRTVLVTAW